MSVPHPKDLSSLVSLINQELGPEGDLLSSKTNVERIMALMANYTSNREDWEKYALFDHSRAYTRNLVDDGNGRYNLMILAWSAGQRSPIHDHAGSHCIMKILEGELHETQYDWPLNCGLQKDNNELDITSMAFGDFSTEEGSPLEIIRENNYILDKVAYINDDIGLHRIANPSPSKGAVSLHLYTPAYETCKTFNEFTGKSRSGGKCLFYSKRGVRE